MDDSLSKGVDYLLKTQNEDGSWGKKPQPAVAALCALALHNAPTSNTAARDEAVDAAMAFVLSHVDEEDGAIRGEAPRILFFKLSPWPVYTTSISLVALAEINKPEYLPVMKAAREYLKSMQSAAPDSPTAGGFGYDQRKRPDMSNTNWTLEALYLTRHLDDEPFGTASSRESSKKVWKQANEFLKNMQAPPDSEGEHAGGFAYKHKSEIVATGTMTYAGLKSMIYAEVDDQDPRVRGALKWIGRNYTFEEVPGAKMRGYFYYIQTMTKALGAANVDNVPLEGGKTANWRQDAAGHLISLQRTDGSWYNPDGKYLESLPELVTAYAMISLKNTSAK
jgi:squalene-hopene/tetraprenyl-beta-curcumene cyclase